MGKVYLLGAGPGDPGLITIKAKEILSQADVIVQDHLIAPELLDFCKKDAEIIYAGKRGGNHALPQSEINHLLISLARRGLQVARLKGGDPYIFGRGAEEAQELVKADIDFEVVPGVTAAAAAAVYAGIPLTHRKYASSVIFISGHEDRQKDQSVHNWSALAASGSTLVFYMTIKKLPSITARLIDSGMNPKTPAALVHWGATPRQKVLCAELGEIAAKAVQEDFQPPSLLIIGEVISLRSQLNWFERKPLFGVGIAVTRARAQAGKLSSALRELGARVFEYPVIKIEAVSNNLLLHQAIKELSNYAWIIFSSVNGVEIFWKELLASGHDARSLSKNRLAAIGPATAEALLSRGVRPDFVPEVYVGEALAEGLKEFGLAGTKILIVRATQARDVIPDELERSGAEVNVVPVYRTTQAEARAEYLLEALRAGDIQVITFTSSSTVKNFFMSVAQQEIVERRKGLTLAAIGPITAKTLEKFSFHVDITAEKYTIDGLVEALVDWQANNRI